MQTEAERDNAQSAPTDYYETLQVSPKAEPEVIEAAYKRLALKYHPDLNPTPEATRRMQELNVAYTLLSNPERRAEYDRERAPAKSSRQARYVRRRRSKAPAQPEPQAQPQAQPENEAVNPTPETGPEPQPAADSDYHWAEDEFEREEQENAEREWVYVAGSGPRWGVITMAGLVIIALALVVLLVLGNGHAANGESESLGISQKILLPPNVIFDDDLDTVAGANWILDAPWHLTTRRAASGTHSLWIGDEVRNSYSSGLNASATLARPVDLSNTQNPLLRFRLNGQFDSEVQATGNDKLMVEVAEPGHDFEAAYTISGSYANWQDVLVDLSKWKGKTVLIRFRFTSSPTSLANYSGPFVDDIRIER